MNLQGRTAIVTGASRGLGRSIAMVLAQHGANLVVAARTVTEPLDSEGSGTITATKADIEALGANVLAIETDVTKDADIANLVERSMEHFGRIDVLVNNAGIGATGDVTTCTMSDFDRLISVNLRAPFLAIQAVAPVMKRQGSGAIVNVSSILADQIADDVSDPIVVATAATSGKGVTAYGVSKAALIRLTIGAAADLLPFGISVNCIKPSWTDTDGLRRWFPEADRSTWSKPEHWGWAIAYLASSNPKTCTGLVINDRDLELLIGAKVPLSPPERRIEK